MRYRVWLGAAAIFAGLAAVGLLLTSCATVDRAVAEPPLIEGATFVGNKACADCHKNITQIFPASPHARFYRDDNVSAGKTGCESCHGAGSKHVAAGGGRGKFIINPGHDPSICMQCHLEVHAELNLPYHHPVVEGRMNCVQCHDPHGHDIFKPAGGLAMARRNESCAQCHRDQSRPFAFVHEAMWEGCTVCHTPHGSISPKLLLQRDNNLCLRCHSQIQSPEAPGSLLIGKFDHTNFIRGRTCWSAGCHPAVHGSNISAKFHY
jgi:predicted CXXCH cytochrome family protein